MSLELTASIVINLIVLSFFAGIYVCTIKMHGKQIEDLKSYFKEQLERVEKKQDKHNDIIERTYCNEKRISVLEEQVKVENHRIEDLEGVQNECMRHRN